MTMSDDGLWARVANMMLGGWLFLSAFVWNHGSGQRVDAAVVGFLIFVAALASVTSVRVRFANTALAAWLFLSTLAIPGPKAGTEWNNVLVALAVFLLSLVGPHVDDRITVRVRAG